MILEHGSHTSSIDPHGGKCIKELCLSRAANMHCINFTTPVSKCLLDVFVCKACPKVFPTWQQVRLHEFVIHGIKNEARSYIDERNVCPACLRRFMTRTQALRHLHLSTKCADFHVHCTPVPDEIACDLDDKETKRLKSIRHTTSFFTCAVRHLPTIIGPLPKAFIHCFKGRPRIRNSDC